jgi:hypothetical protein
MLVPARVGTRSACPRIIPLADFINFIGRSLLIASSRCVIISEEQNMFDEEIREIERF